MSTAVESSSESPQISTQNAASVDVLADSLEKSGIHGDAQDTQGVAEAEVSHSRPRIVYSRKQLVHLSQSPLVKVPDGMPAFKAWFGELNEQSLLSAKKESETLSTNGANRERRFRREPEDGDGSARPPFRSALSQPSQMGNFKHQPLRSSDRDRDTERDLRSLSDRYDRDKATRGDRMGLPSHSTLLRTRDRDSAPHLAPDRDTQRTLARKRNGESKEDWRRGAEPPRAAREENNTRRDRDDRERQRSRARDNSRTRDSPPATRREREREEQRRERDRDRFNEADENTKRWREEGKREDKMGSRRDKDRTGREKDGGRDRSREAADERDGWSIADDKKRSARDRRYDDGRDREDRKGREKEKEPAWMETYIPPSSSSVGILGGKGEDGELDSIQAWKRDMKEREMKAKGLISEPSASTLSSTQDAHSEAKQPEVSCIAPEGQLDEIQLFKLMMKKAVVGGVSDERQESSDAPLHSSESSIPGLMRIRDGATGAPSAAARVDSPGGVTSENGPTSAVDPLVASKSGISLTASVSTTSLVPSPSGLSGPGAPKSLTDNGHSSLVSNGPRLLSLKTLETSSLHGDPANKEVATFTTSFEPPRQSRLLAFGSQNAKVTAQPSPQSAAAAVQMGRLQQMDPSWPSQRRSSVSPAIPLSASQQSGFDKANLLQQQQQQQQQLVGGQFDMNTENMSRLSGYDSTSHNVFYENAHRSGNSVDANRQFVNVDVARSSIPLSASDRAGFLSQSDSLHHMADMRRNPTPPTANYGVTSPTSPFDSQQSGGQSTYSSGKGSRMAKHFERQRDQSAHTGRNLPNSGLGTNGMMMNRQEQPLLNNSLGGGENRNIQDLLTMLNNSAQAQRGHPNQNISQHQLPQSIHVNNSMGRHESLLDPDDGRFAPDGLVPGLRPAAPPAPRSRDVSSGGLYANQLDDSFQFNGRLGPQQRSGVDQLFASQVPSQYNGQILPNGGRGGLSFHQQAMRSGPSPINNFNPVQGLPQQRLPPGLANLGGRPPHEPSQFLGSGAGNFGGVPSQLHAGMQHVNNQQPFNQFQNQGLGMVGNQGHLRGQPGFGQLGPSSASGLSGIDIRGAQGGLAQNQMLGLGGPSLGQAMRGGPGFNGQQLHVPNQLPPSINVRQQQNLQPQMLQQLFPQHMQSIPPGQHNPSDLMALLMGNAHRE